MRIFIAAISLVLIAYAAGADDSTVLQSRDDRISYAIGMDIGKYYKRQSVNIDPDLISRGIRDAIAGNKPLLTEQELLDLKKELNDRIITKQMKRMKAAAEDNRKNGKIFLEKNSRKDGVVVRPSGLQYRVLREGIGESPDINDTVKVNYKGTLIDGTEFDNSYKRGQPATFRVSEVINGWTEALQLMKVGAKWRLFIPPDLAYGERGAGRSIGPNTTLIFDVELLSIETGAKE